MNDKKTYDLSDFTDPAFGQRCIELGMTRSDVHMLEFGFPTDRECLATPGLREYATQFFARPEIVDLWNKVNPPTD